MKKLFIFLSFALLLISCSRDDSENSESYNGKWFVRKIEGSYSSSSTGTINYSMTMDECNGKSYFNISNQNVTYLEFSTCANYETFSGSYNHNTKKLTLQNYDDQSIANYDVEFVNEEMFLKNTNTTTSGNETVTTKTTFICSK